VMLIERYKWNSHKADTRDALRDGGWDRSSVEEPVMGLERRVPRGDADFSDNRLREDLAVKCKRVYLLVNFVSKSRVMGDYQARFCERLGVKFPRPTRPPWSPGRRIGITMGRSRWTRLVRDDRAMRIRYSASS
jgi:hypothetical protein